MTKLGEIDVLKFVEIKLRVLEMGIGFLSVTVNQRHLLKLRSNPLFFSEIIFPSLLLP